MTLYAPKVDQDSTGDYIGGSSSVVTYDKTIGKLSAYTSGGLKASEIGTTAGENFTAPGKHKIWVESTGEYTGGYFLTYTIKAVKYSAKEGNITVKLNNSDAVQTYKYNPAGHDVGKGKVDVYLNNGTTPTLINMRYNSTKNSYTVSWKDSKIGEEGGTLTIKGTGTIFSGTIKVKYNVVKADIGAAKNSADYKNNWNSETVYYELNSKLRGSSTIPTKLVQYAITSFDKYGDPVYTKKELKAKTDYTVTADSESSTDTSGAATFDATSAKNYDKSIKLVYDLYPNEIKSVAITLSNNGKVALSDNEVDETDSIQTNGGTGIQITKVVVTFKDSKVKAETIEGWDKVKEACNIEYTDNTVATTKAKVTISFKKGTIFPTGTSYYKNYTITAK